ncbi:phage tail collar domain protein [mine drainage metagenome]|uniref:Phage tail collar domain protein n=1 Tax=mine drainage metagenome TaxID=410659 RepID=A0A1J5RFA5_9ZZZZ
MDSFFGEVRAFAFNFAPENWALCNGQAVSSSQYQVLYSIVGTMYGTGSTSSSFKLPNLVGTAALGSGSGPGLSPYVVGEDIGSEKIMLNAATMGAHNHLFQEELVKAPFTGVQASPLGASLARPVKNTSGSQFAATKMFSNDTPGVTMSGQMVGPAGPASGPQPHGNMQPYQTVNFCICMVGDYYPQRQ